MEVAYILEVIKVKKSRLLLFIFLVFGCCFIISLNVLSAPLLTLLPEQRYNLFSDDTDTYQFSLNYETEICIDLMGYNDEYYIGVDGTYGEYLITITDHLGEIVYEKSDSSKFEDREYYTVLLGGDYTLSIKNIGTGDLSYIISVSGWTIEDIPITSLKLNKSSLTMTKGSTYQLIAKYAPKNTSENIKWKSSNSKIVSVDSDGELKAKKMGKVTITASSTNLKKKCTVSVNKQHVEMWNKKSKSLLSFVDQIKGYEKAKWYSSDKSVVSVTSNGKITTKKHGTAKIYCKIKDVKYTFYVYSYAKSVMKEEAIYSLKSKLKNPNSLIINNIYYPSVGVVELDYSAMNGFGGYNRNLYEVKYKRGEYYPYYY
jgi:hypothetical protein